MMSLSILICTLENRKQVFDKLMENLGAQIMCCPAESVEVLFSCDNGEKTTGSKRDFLLRRAMGDYLVFIDDDDEVPYYYVSEILQAAKSKADCMAINGKMTTDGNHPMKWRISKDFPNVTVRDPLLNEDVYLRTTNHISPVRRDIAVQGGFPDIRNGEDKAYSESILPFLKTEVEIKLPMYHYIFKNIPKLYK
jgi:hypothetical protein